MKNFSLLLLALFVTGCQTSLVSNAQQPLQPQQLSNQQVAEASSELIKGLLENRCVFSQQELVATETPYKNLMSEIRVNLNLPYVKNNRVKVQQDWYARHPAYLERTFKRGSPFLYLIASEVEKRGLPMELALLPIVESAFDPFAYSHGRASGIWQFVPWTGRRYGMKQNWWYDGRRDVYAATLGALDYLTRLHKYFDGDWLLALAAYNSGEGNVSKAVKRNKKLGKPTDFWSLNLPKETRAYVPKLLALAELVRNPEKYQLQFKKIDNSPFLRRVSTGSQIDLALAADLAELSIEETYRYNAAFNRWATDPDGPHFLLLPINNAEIFEKNLKQLKPENRIKWVRYKIKPGDSISTIARKFRTSKELIISVNNIRNNQIRAGKTLTIPSATKSLNTYTLSADRRLAKITSKPRKGSKLYHYVVAGDSMWDISRKYKVNLRALAKWNGMAPTDKLSIGKKLTVWVKSNSAKAIVSNAPSKTRKIRYKVRNGDSLARISDKFQVKMKDLMRWNKLNPAKYLQPGQSLTLFVDVLNQTSR